MEQGMTPSVDVVNHLNHFKGGFMLVTVLVITAVGLLFGAGALLLFRYQCQMRVDRQHELEKVYAVRSALNYIRTYIGEIRDDEGKSFKYHTGSERDLGLLVKPVAAIFPRDDQNHFFMERGHFIPCSKQYSRSRDYEYGAEKWTNSISKLSKEGEYGIAINDPNATNSVKWWVNIGMRGTGGWLQEDYGRRYSFWPKDYVDGNERTKDVMRLCIIRNVTNLDQNVGCRHGWPLSKDNERALVFQITPDAGNNNVGINAIMTLSEYWYDKGLHTQEILRFRSDSLCNMGMQIAGDKVSVFYVGNGEKNENTNVDPSARGYSFSETAQMSVGTYKYFLEEVPINNISYGGIHTNADGRVEAPELRAVLEIEAASDSRKENEHPTGTSIDFLTRFRVTPAYQYDVFLEHPAGVTNRATVAQKRGKYQRIKAGLEYSFGYTMLTYDTHGTEHKGFRQDEREARLNGK